MVSFNQLCDYKKEIETQKFKNSSRTDLNIFERFFSERTNDLLYQITNRIEKESGWEYMPGGFTFPSDFQYDGSDITFKVNRVPCDFSVEDLNERELVFATKYAPLLQQLATLEQKKKKYLLPDNVLPMTAFRIPFERKKSQFDMSRYWQQTFIMDILAKYPGLGIEGFVSALNAVSDSADTISAAEAIKKKGLYHKDILQWISSFSRRGNLIYEQCIDAEVKARILADIDASMSSSFMKDESDVIIYQIHHHGEK